MPTEFKLPELGENITAGDVVRVLIKPGDTIAKDQAILELETDKATIEVPSSVAGVVKDVQIKAGEKIKVGQVILTVDGEGKDAKGSKEPAESKESKPAAQPAGDATKYCAAATGRPSQRAVRTRRRCALDTRSTSPSIARTLATTRSALSPMAEGDSPPGHPS